MARDNSQIIMTCGGEYQPVWLFLVLNSHTSYWLFFFFPPLVDSDFFTRRGSRHIDPQEVQVAFFSHGRDDFVYGGELTGMTRRLRELRGEPVFYYAYERRGE